MPERDDFGVIFAIVTTLIIAIQVGFIAPPDSRLGFGYLLLLALLTCGSALAAGSLLVTPGNRSGRKGAAAYSLALCLFVTGVLIFLALGDLSDWQEVGFWEYIFLLLYAGGFGSAGVVGLTSGE